MDPFRPVVIDNRPPVAQFIEGDPQTDGMANLFASIINAPIAASQIRRQREMDQRAMDRQDMADRLNQQQFERQIQQQDRQQSNWMDQFKQHAEMLAEQKRINQANADRQAQADAMNQAYKFGVVPEMNGPLRPNDNMRALWAAASMGDQERQIRQQHQSAQDLGALFKTMGASTHPQGPLRISTKNGATVLLDPKTQQRIGIVDQDGNVTWGDQTASDITASNLDSLDASSRRRILDAVKTYQEGGWFGHGKGDASALSGLDPALVREAFTRQGFTVPSGMTPTTPVQAPMQSGPSPQEMQAWKTVLADRRNPNYAASIQKLKRWQSGIDENGQPMPQLKQWADQVIASLNAPTATGK